MDQAKRKSLESLLKILENIRGRHTELVTVYIPAGFSLNKVAEQIRQEQSTAQNIKSKAVRKNVLSALEKINQRLKLYKQTPQNGLAIFCGNVSERKGVNDIEIWVVEPPEPLKVRLYRCDQKFILDPIKDMVREREIYGLIVLDKSEADIGLLKGKRIETLKHLESIVPGKTKAGGWSQARYQRIRENLLNDFLKKIGEVANAQLKGLKDLKGIIIGGPGGVKDQFVNGDYLEYSVKKKVLGIIDTSYCGQPGLTELVDRSEDIISEASVIKEKKVLDRFFEELARDGLAVYGFDETMNMLRQGNIETLLISEDFDWVRARLVCRKCNEVIESEFRNEFLSDERCPKCDSKMYLESKEELIDDIIKLAERMGSVVEIISSASPRGGQLKELGGIAGILRFRV